MALKLIEMAEADLPEYVHVYASAFEGGYAAQALIPGGTSSAYEEFLLQHEQALFGAHNRRYLAVVDSSLSEIICVALWKFEDKSSLQSPREKSKWYPEGNIEAKEAFFGMIRRARLAVMGQDKAYWHLSLLATKPGHERRGAGHMALAWGTRHADRDGLEAFLDASPMGKPLYQKFGFDTVSEQELQLSQYGVDHVYVSTSMVRQPQNLK